MEKKVVEERWGIANSTENAVKAPEDGGEEEEDEEETLSLSDLPINHQSRKEKEEEITPLRAETKEDFDFCYLSKESEMCAADEVFFQGQILPLRHSVSSEKGRNFSRSISRSESMDNYCSGGLVSSRSSSISSHQSSTSGSGSSAATTEPKYKPILPPRNQFHSHPSPSPRIRFPSSRRGMVRINNKNCAQKSSVWNVFRVGLVTTPPEIAFQDLKTRCPTNTNSTNFGSRNSTSSNSSSFSSSSGKKKKKLRALLGGCKCSSNAVDTVPSRVVIIKRSESESEALRLEEESLQQRKPPELMKQQAAKKRFSHHRTFEWLKQLSLEDAADEQ